MEKQLVMISQPMQNRTEEEIKEVRERATEYLESKGFDVLNIYFPNKYEEFSVSGVVKDVKHVPLWFLAQSLEAMAECDAVYFCEGWEKTRGCLIEHNAAAAYGLEMMYEL